jgi:hypothetical protein
MLKRSVMWHKYTPIHYTVYPCDQAQVQPDTDYEMRINYMSWMIDRQRQHKKREIE